MTDFDEVSVSEAQWAEVKAMGHTFLMGMLDWGRRHNMPTAVVVGAMAGMADAAFHLMKGCECEDCMEVEMLVGAFTAREMADVMETPSRARGH